MRTFNNVAGLQPRRSVFNLSHYRVMDFDMGYLYPVLIKKLLPGDSFKVSTEILIRAMPMIAPIMHDVSVTIHYFKVPMRILWPKPVYEEGQEPEAGSWVDYITGGQDGTLEPEIPRYPPPSGIIPFWIPGSLWDYFGFPINGRATGVQPDAMPLRAYNLVYNDWYRHPDYQEPVDLDDTKLKRRNWAKDYFTTALYDVVRGIPEAIPLHGIVQADFLNLPDFPLYEGSRNAMGGNIPWVSTQQGGTNDIRGYAGTGDTVLSLDRGDASQTVNASYIRMHMSPNFQQQWKEWLSQNAIDLNLASTFGANDLRYAFQVHKFLERSMRAGNRYKEFLLGHYGVNIGDDRLQRPEYLGGVRVPIIVSEVLQTSRTIEEDETADDPGSPQGNMAGHGISVSQTKAFTCYAQEFCVLIGIMSMRPKPVYQQGMPREWIAETRYDEFIPEFVNLGEQPVFNAEVFVKDNDATYNRGTFGFQGRYDEYRYAQNQICGSLRSGIPDSLHHWHLARYFDPFGTPPALNSDFLEVVDDKRYSAVQKKPAWLAMIGHNIRAVRPLPIVGTPGLIDHN